MQHSAHSPYWLNAPLAKARSDESGFPRLNVCVPTVRGMDAQTSTMPEDLEAPRRFFLVNWIVIGAMGAALALSVAVRSLSAELTGFALAAGYVGLSGGLSRHDGCAPLRRDPQVMFMFGGIVQIVLMTAIMTPLAHLAAVADISTHGAKLFAIDRALGTDVAAYVRFIDDHPALSALANFAYTMMRWPIFVVPVALAAIGRYRRVEEFTFGFGAALSAMTVIAALLPSGWAGVLQPLQLSDVGGVVVSPTFHAACAVLCVWALWPVRWSRPILACAAGLALAAVPIEGGHLLIVLIAGIAVGVLAITAARCVALAIVRRPRVDRAESPPFSAIVPAE
jgi:PAP2 superfamily